MLSDRDVNIAAAALIRSFGGDAAAKCCEVANRRNKRSAPESTIAERIVDRATTSVGQPKFLLALIAVVSVWITVNAFDYATTPDSASMAA